MNQALCVILYDSYSALGIQGCLFIIEAVNRFYDAPKMHQFTSESFHQSHYQNWNHEGYSHDYSNKTFFILK